MGEQVKQVKQAILLTWVQKAHYLVGMVRPARDGTGEMARWNLSRELRTVEVRRLSSAPVKNKRKISNFVYHHV